MDEETKKRAKEARSDLLKHMRHVQEIMIEARNLVNEHPHAVEELQIVVGSLGNSVAGFRDINARLNGSLPLSAQKEIDPPKGRKHVHYKGPRGWEAAEIRTYNAEKRTVRIALSSGVYKTVSVTSGLVK